MDLLGGYDSNSDSDAEPIAPAPQPPVMPNKSIAMEDKKKKSNLKRGKKLLKLSSVLPEHIWNQLSKGGPQEDSDEEEDDKTKERRQPQKKRLPGDNSDLTSLLNALPKSKTGNSLLGKTSSILGEDSASTIIQGSSSSKDKETSNDGLGSAFLSSTVEVVRTKKSNSVVRDIHKTKPSPFVVETVDDEDDEDENDGQLDPEAKRQKVLPPQVVPIASVSSIPRPRAAPTTSQIRTAAPPVASRYPPPPSTSYQAYPTASATMSSYTQQSQQQPQRSNKKSRKRQMEQMLRQGNLDGITSDVHLEGTENVYQMPQDQQTSSYQSHGVRVVPTTQYNVGTGSSAASINISGKQRGKNQMNALLASAASLESQRARMPQSQQTHRANARSKYGW